MLVSDLELGQVGQQDRVRGGGRGGGELIEQQPVHRLVILQDAARDRLALHTAHDELAAALPQRLGQSRDAPPAIGARFSIRTPSPRCASAPAKKHKTRR